MPGHKSDRFCRVGMIDGEGDLLVALSWPTRCGEGWERWDFCLLNISITKDRKWDFGVGFD